MALGDDHDLVVVGDFHAGVGLDWGLVLSTGAAGLGVTMATATVLCWVELRRIRRVLTARRGNGAAEKGGH